MRSRSSRTIPFGGGGGGGYGGGGGGGGTASTDYGAGGGAGGSYSVVDATFTPSTLPWDTGDLRSGSPGEVLITTLPPPDVSTVAATDITADSARVSASVNPNGVAMGAVAIAYGTDAAQVASGAGTQEALSPAAASGTAAVALSTVLEGLLPDTTYYFRATGSSPGGEGTGAVLSFTTLAMPVTAPAGSPPAAGPVVGPATPSASRLPGMRTRSFVRRGWVLTVGVVPARATSVVQVATRVAALPRAQSVVRAATPSRHATVVRRRCATVRRPGGVTRAYRCSMRLGTGTWRVLTQARAGSRVVGQRPVVLRVVAPTRVRVTG